MGEGRTSVIFASGIPASLKGTLSGWVEKTGMRLSRDLVGALGVVVGTTLFGLAALDWVSYSTFLTSLFWR